jgi:hypothetical protein
MTQTPDNGGSAFAEFASKSQKAISGLALSAGKLLSSSEECTQALKGLNAAFDSLSKATTAARKVMP